jgi:four helix bundle protein
MKNILKIFNTDRVLIVLFMDKYKNSVMNLENLTIYSSSMDLSNLIWKVVINWDYFSKSTIGNQLVRAADSIPANISEGFGRYHFKEQKQFLYYARGSLFETKTFIEMAFKRNLIDEDTFNSLNAQLNILGRKLNCFIKSVGNLENPPKQ